MLVTFNEMWAFSTFMMAPLFEKSRNMRPENSAAARLAGASRSAVLAAVLPQIVGQQAQRLVVGGVEVEGPLPARLHHARVDQPLQVVTEGRRRHVQMRLDRACGGPFRPRLHDEPKDRQAHGVTERAELFRVMTEPVAHFILLHLSK